MEDIERAIQVLRDGGVVIFPTDTAFGIGCRIDDVNAVKHLFDIRKRPYDKAAPVLVNSISMAQDYLETIPDRVRSNLMEKYWPGGLTIVLMCISPKVPDLVRGGKDTLGVRMPDHDILRTIIEKVGVPILAPSANFAGEATPFLFEELNPILAKQVDFVLKGECNVRQASTVIDCTVNPWKILREGAVTIEL